MKRKFFRVFFFIFILLSLVSCHKHEDETTTSVEEIIQIHDDVLSLLNNQCQNGTDVETALNNCIGQIQSYSNVSSAYLNDNQLVINYQSGTTSFILFLPEEIDSSNNKLYSHKQKHTYTNVKKNQKAQKIQMS